jgi:hypothetical protein
VAQERLQIRLDAVDNTKKAFSSLKGSIFNIRNALAGLGIGLFVKQIVDTGKQVENLGLRFKFLFGSAKEGAKAFDVLTKFAARVPFSLEEISGASGNLAVVSKDADELAKILEITGNVAAVTGLDFRQTAEQIQRSFSGGIASADVFRERGVSSLLGFSAGASVSAEETAKKFEEVFGKGGRFGNATAELATTFGGVLSMLGDKLFAFKKTINDAGFFEAFKTQFRLLDQFLQDNSRQLESIATSIGESLATAVQALGRAVLFVYENMDKFVLAIEAFIAYKLIAIVTALGESFVILAGKIAQATGSLTAFNTATAGLRKIGAFLAIFLSFSDKLDEFRDKMKLLGEETKRTSEEFDKFAIGEFSQDLDIVNKKLTLMEELFGKISEAYQKVFGKSQKDLLVDFGKTIEKGFEGVTKGIGDATAQSIVFGKKFSEVLKGAVRQALANVISDLVTMGIRIIINTQLAKAMQSVIGGGGSGIGGFLGGIFGGSNMSSTGINLSNISPFAEGGSIKAGQPALVGERGRELFVPSSDGQIIKNEDLGMGATVNFTIVANDTKDFDRLLIERRSTITNIINQALNQRGKASLV